jgi:glycosyltransferase involved in cell wall biosynthesis
MTGSRIAIVIPVYNESGFVGPALAQITAEVEPVAPDYSIILVENGSTDETFSEASEYAETDPRVRVMQSPEPNYGLAMRYGMESVVDQDWIVVFNIDYFSGSFVKEVLGLTDLADVVIASKRAPGSVDKRPFVRRLGTRVFNLILRKAVGSKVSDTHGIKAFRRTTVVQLLGDVQLTQDLFDTELVIRAERAGYRIIEVPIVVEELREARSSLIRRIPRTLMGIRRLRRTLRASA